MSRADGQRGKSRMGVAAVPTFKVLVDSLLEEVLGGVY